ncbi:MAG: hypothetical protein H0U74_24025 [Bradymonadaceae bacterium]|nr:hypothetical protein [Lujinxingiaceae bacterium]
MAQRPLPEAIRGCWYYLTDATPPAQARLKPLQLLKFRVDGSFARFQLKDHVKKELEAGTYTFDGQFLILRGRNTDTFRVYPKTFWKWGLEGRKDDQALVRGLVTEEEFVELASEDQKEIRILPIRVTVRGESGAGEGIYELVYQPLDRELVSIGSFFVERHDDDRLWIGLSPYVSGIEAKTWERIVRDSYLDIFLSKPKDVAVVTVRLLDSNDSRVFNYQNS